LAGRRLLLFVRITDRPGGLARLLAVISEAKANVIEVEHVREGVDLHVRETGIRVAMEVRNREHAEQIVAAVRAAGYAVNEPGSR
jgi:threonine dehydratase